MKFKIYWSKTYYASGTKEIEAESSEEALAIAKDQVGDYEGSLQYDPDKDYFEEHGEVG